MEATKLRIAGESDKAITKRVYLTMARIEALKCPTHKPRVYVYDSARPGLAVMVTDKGSKSFYVIRKINGRPERYRLGGYPDINMDKARDMADQINGQIAEGIDPAAERRAIRKDATLQECWERWRDEHAKPRLRPRTLETDASRYKTCFADWTSRRVHTIRPADVQRKIDDLGKRLGHTTANRAAQLLRRLLSFARVTPNPCGKGEVRFFREEPRERYLGADELVKLLAAIEAEPNTTIADFATTCFWTGQRRGNVASMEWSEVDLVKAIWCIPGTKTKTHKPHVVPLVQPVIGMLKTRQGNDSQFVFPGHGETGHLQEPKGGWARILKRAGLVDVHLHDLRHNVASWAVQHGADLYAVGKVLGHANASTTQRYAHLALDPLRATMQTSATAMQNAMTASVKAAKKAAQKEVAK